MELQTVPANKSIQLPSEINEQIMSPKRIRAFPVRAEIHLLFLLFLKSKIPLNTDIENK